MGDATDSAEPVFGGVRTAASEAGASLRGFCHGAHGVDRIRVASKPLHRLESRSDGFVAGLGVMQVLFQPPEEIVNRGILGEFPLGSSLGRISHRSGLFFVIHSTS